MSPDERKRLVVQSRNFCLPKETLYHKGADGIWRRAIWQFEKEAILCEAHCSIVGGHYARETTAQKIWNSRLWWSIVDNATCVNVWANLMKRIGYLINQCCRSNLFKNGVSILSSHLNRRRQEQVTDMS